MTKAYRIFLPLLLLAITSHSLKAEEFIPFPVLEMAPGDHWIVRLDPRYAVIDEEFDSSGNKTDTLFKSSYTYVRFILAYGVTDDLTVGAVLPYGQFCSQPRGALSDPATQAFITGLGYSTPAKHCRNETGDLILGGFWRFDKSAAHDWVAGFGLSLGTSEEDNPDDLIDVHLGEGNDDIILQLENFHRWGHLDTRVLIKGTVQLQDRSYVRVPESPGLSIAPADNLVVVDRDLGDILELELELGNTFGDMRVAGGWAGYRKLSDDYSGRVNGFDASNLEANTDETRQLINLSLSWHSIRLWKQKRFPLPVVADIEWQRVFAGKNSYEINRLYMTVKFVL